MKYHKWKYNTDLDGMICQKCGIAKVKDKETNNIVYIDFSKDPYLRDREKIQRPDCKTEIKKSIK